MNVIIVKSRVKADKVALYEETFRDLQAKVLANEPWILFYALCRVPGPGHDYRVIEASTDPALQERHLATDYYQAASAIFMDCLVDGGFEMEVVEAI